MRRAKPKRLRAKSALVRGSVLAGLAGASALTAKAFRQRYVTGLSRVQEVVDNGSGVLVILADGRIFWAPQNQRNVLQTYVGDGAPALSYRVDLFRRTRNGLPVGEVNIKD